MKNLEGKIRVLYITSLGAGGAERYLIEVCNRINRYIFKPFLYYPEGDATLLSLLREDVEVIRGPRLTFRFRRPFISLYTSIRTLYNLVKVIKSQRIDLVHVSILFPSHIYPLSTKITGVPIVLTLTRDWELYPFPIRLWFLIARFCGLQSYAKYIGVPYHKNTWARAWLIPDHKFFINYHGVDTNWFSPREKELSKKCIGFDEDTPVLTVIARLFKVKGVHKAIGVLPFVKKRHPNIKLLIVGSGPEKENLQNLCQQLGVEKEVFFIPFQKDVRPFLAAADLYLQTTDNPLIGQSTLEALAMGKPIITFCKDEKERKMAIETCIPGYNGEMVNTLDLLQAGEIISDLLEEQEKLTEMGKNSRKLALQKFDLAHNIKRIENLYISIVRKREVLR